MFSIYLFALVIGGGLLLVSLFGPVDDLGDHGDVGHASVGDHAVNPVQWLSLRSAMYFLFVFGGVGAVLTKTWPAIAAPIIAALAFGSALAVGAAVSWTFGYLRRTESGFRTGDESFVGLTGRMTLPFTESGAGKVMITRADRSYELTARAFDRTQGDPTRWGAVVVVEMDRGIALVAPMDPAANGLPSLDTQ